MREKKIRKIRKFQDKKFFDKNGPQKRHSFPIFCFGGPFSYHVRACCLRASTTAVLQYREHSTAQHSTAQRNQPAQSRKTSTCRSECDNASKQTEYLTYLTTTVYCSTAKSRTAQHSTAQSARAKPQSKYSQYVPIRLRQRKQADRVGESQHTSSSIYTAR